MTRNTYKPTSIRAADLEVGDVVRIGPPHRWEAVVGIRRVERTGVVVAEFARGQGTYTPTDLVTIQAPAGTIDRPQAPSFRDASEVK
jgi:hypothetical protein